MKKLLLFSLVLAACAVSNVSAKAKCGSCKTVSESEKPTCFTERVIRDYHCPEKIVSYACPVGSLEE